MLAGATTELPAGEGAKPEFWYEDNNLGAADGIPPDFFSRYEEPSTWSQARRLMHTFYLRQNQYRQHLQSNLFRNNDAFLANMARVHSGIHLAYDCVEATWAHCWNRYLLDGLIKPNYSATISELKQLQSAGFQLTDIGLQSVLSKPAPDWCSNYSMHYRIRDVVEFFRQVKPRFPGVRIGILDALPAHNRDYRDPYSELQAALVDIGYQLDFVHLDMPFHLPRHELNGNSWEKVVQVGQFVQQTIGTTFGLVCTDAEGGGRTGPGSNNDFRAFVLEGIQDFIKAGGEADQYILSAWYPYPDHTIPDDLLPIPPHEASQLRTFRDIPVATQAAQRLWGRSRDRA